MGGTVDHPDEIQADAPPEQRHHMPGGIQGLAPQVHGQGGGQDEANNRHQPQVVLLLEHYQGIGLQIGEIYLLALLHHLGMFAAAQPSDVGKEPTAL